MFVFFRDRRVLDLSSQFLLTEPTAPVPRKKVLATHKKAPITYEEMTIGMIMMTKPTTKHVRTSGHWMGPNVLQAPDEYFSAMIIDGTSTLVLHVPKSLSNEAAKFKTATNPANATKVVVEGEVRQPLGSIVIVVRRFGN